MGCFVSCLSSLSATFTRNGILHEIRVLSHRHLHYKLLTYHCLLGWPHEEDCFYGAELDGTRSDKSELLQYAISDSCAKGTLIMIGDRKHDIIGGLANGMDVIGVTYGFGSIQELHEAGASRLVNHPTELLPLLSLKADGQ